MASPILPDNTSFWISADQQQRVYFLKQISFTCLRRPDPLSQLLFQIKNPLVLHWTETFHFLQGLLL